MNAMKEIPAVQKYMKNPAQGAATTLWAAVGKCWEGTKSPFSIACETCTDLIHLLLGKGGIYLDDCQVCPPVPQPTYELLDRGYEKWAYDVESEEKLWKISNELVGFEE
jgi:hypothetical protein